MNDNYTDVQLRIIKAARKLFAKKGFKGATIRGIASEAKVSVAMINYHFNSKEELFDSIMEETFAKIHEESLSILDSGLPFFELIRKWVYSHYDLYLKYPDYPFILNSESVKNPQTWIHKPEPAHHVLKKLSKLLEKEKAKGTVQPISASDLLLLFISLVDYPILGKTIALQCLNLPEKEYMKSLHKYKECVADFLIRAIKK